MSRLAPVPVAAVLVAALTGCSAGTRTDPVAQSPSGTPSPTASATVPASKPPTVPPRPTAKPVVTLPTDLADGVRHYARLKSMDPVKRTFTLDVVQFLTGEAAEKAAADDGEEAFDYYIRNTNPRLRTITYASGPTIVVNTLTAAETGSSSKDTKISVPKLSSFFSKGQAQRRVFWFTLKGGAIVTLTEQYLP